METDKLSNPYLGLSPFSRAEKELFFGRDDEADELCSRIKANKFVFLYAQSGAGKTSLLNARIQDLLEADGFKLLRSPRWGSKLPAEVRVSEIENIFIFNTLLSLNDNAEIRRLQKLKLIDFLHQDFPELANIRFVLIFDQFEEIFTTYPGRGEDRKDFFAQIQTVAEEFPHSRFVFALREDFLALLDRYLNILDSTTYRFRLELLEKSKAIDAVKGPAHYRSREYADGVAEKIVSELLKTQIPDEEGRSQTTIGEFVEPVQLQLVCQKLWDTLKPEEKEITRNHFEQIGDVDKVLIDYYKESIQALQNKKGFPGEFKIRQWIEECLITELNTRDTVLRKPNATEVMGMPVEMIQALEDDRRLLRTEPRAGARWVSLSHDRLIDPIKQSNALERTGRRQRHNRNTVLAVIFFIPFIITLVLWRFAGTPDPRGKALDYLLSGKKHFEQNEYTEAKSDLLRSLEAHKTPDASLLLAKTYLKLEAFEQAFEQLQKTLEIDPRDAETYYHLGQLCLDKGNQAKGCEALSRYFQLRNDLSPREVLTPSAYTTFVAHYFADGSDTVASPNRKKALAEAIRLKNKRVHFRLNGNMPESGFDAEGFVAHVLKKSGTLNDNQDFSIKYLSNYQKTNSPQPMDLIYFPEGMNIVMFNLGNFFGEELCIGIGLSAYVEIVDVQHLPFARSWYQVPYEKKIE